MILVCIIKHETGHKVNAYCHDNVNLIYTTKLLYFVIAPLPTNIRLGLEGLPGTNIHSSLFSEFVNFGKSCKFRKKKFYGIVA
jgi:hypothetical protein